MKKRYRVWHLPVLSFYSKPFYRNVAARWKGTSLGCLYLLLAICIIPAVRDASRHTIKTIDRYMEVYLMQVPPMRLSDGILTVDAPQPYSVIAGNRTMLLIDTTGRIQTPEQEDTLVLLTQTQLHIRQPGQPAVVYDLKDFNNMNLNQEIVGGMAARIKRFTAAAYYMVIYLGSLVFFTVAALLLGGIACLIASGQKKSLDYKAGVRIAVVALTPPLIVGGLLAAAGLSVPVVLYIIPVLAYLLIAAGSARQIRPNELYLDDEHIGS